MTAHSRYVSAFGLGRAYGDRCVVKVSLDASFLTIGRFVVEAFARLHLL